MRDCNQVNQLKHNQVQRKIHLSTQNGYQFRMLLVLNPTTPVPQHTLRIKTGVWRANSLECTFSLLGIHTTFYHRCIDTKVSKKDKFRIKNRIRKKVHYTYSSKYFYFTLDIVDILFAGTCMPILSPAVQTCPAGMRQSLALRCMANKCNK